MASTRLTDCVTPLANAWLEIREEYEATHEDRKLVLTATRREPEEQFRLFKIGRRQVSDGSWVLDEDATTSIVTQCDGHRKRSKHNANPAAALDFCVLVGGKVSWDPREYEPVGMLAEQRGLTWGGRWSQLKDYPHIEVP